MIYTAINIGPIIDTLALARKPRELWSASYLFSLLMKCIYETVGKSHSIVSPARVEYSDEEMKAVSGNARAVGLYPDRIYFKGSIDLDSLRQEVRGILATMHPGIPFDYFNIMSTSCDAGKDAEAIRLLNQQLDCLELFNMAPGMDVEKKVLPLLKARTNEDGRKRAQSRLYEIATGLPEFEVKTLYEIARAGREENEKSYDRYVCIVQADGDNVGKTVSNEGLAEGKVLEISEALLAFGKQAARMIDAFGGMPLYAGGDDLLFIAPVVGQDGHDIFELLKKLDEVAFGDVKKAVRDCELKKDGVPIEASLSFGVFCGFVKFPLYEALEEARCLLFQVAKHWKERKTSDGVTIPGPKNVIAWKLRKHSGGSFEATFSRKDQDVESLFRELISETTDDEIVSAIAHKLRGRDSLLATVLRDENSENRLDAFFERTLEFQDNAWFRTVKSLIPKLYESVGLEALPSSLFGLLRTAKFLHGEPVHEDEFIGDL